MREAFRKETANSHGSFGVRAGATCLDSHGHDRLVDIFRESCVCYPKRYHALAGNSLVHLCTVQDDVDSLNSSYLLQAAQENRKGHHIFKHPLSIFHRLEESLTSRR